MAVTVTTDDSSIAVESPYNESFVSVARQMGGKWAKPFWRFDLRDEDRVHKALAEHYGWRPPEAGEPIVTAEITVGDSWWAANRGALVLGGVEVARAFGRDSGARPADGIVITSGRVGSAGSRANWKTIAEEGTCIEIRDIPRSTAQAILAQAATISAIASARIIGDAPRDERADLDAEIVELERRLADAKARRSALGDS